VSTHRLARARPVSRGADVEGVSPVTACMTFRQAPAQMWPEKARCWRRCGRPGPALAQSGGDAAVPLGYSSGYSKVLLGYSRGTIRYPRVLPGVLTSVRVAATLDSSSASRSARTPPPPTACGMLHHHDRCGPLQHHGVRVRHATRPVAAMARTIATNNGAHVATSMGSPGGTRRRLRA
jgi:hypothetical protein